MTYIKEHKGAPFPKQVVLNLDPCRLNTENTIADWFGRIYFQRAADAVEWELKHGDDKFSVRDRMIRLIGLFRGMADDCARGVRAGDAYYYSYEYKTTKTGKRVLVSVSASTKDPRKISPCSLRAFLPP